MTFERVAPATLKFYDWVNDLSSRASGIRGRLCCVLSGPARLLVAGATEQEALENIRSAIAEYLDAVSERTQGQNVREVEVAAS